MSPATRSLFRLLAATLLALAAGAGCAHPHAWLGTAIDLEARRKEVEVPASLRPIAPLPVVALRVSRPRPAAPPAESPAEPTATADAGAAEPQEELAFDARILSDELAKMLEATRLFENVIRLDDDGSDIEVAKAKARASGASLLFAASFGPPSLRRTERPLLAPIALWCVTGWLSCWDHNHTYELSCDVRLRVHVLATDDFLPDPPLPPARAQDEFNFFERSSGWAYLCLLTCCWPPPLCPIDENAIARALAPAALKQPVEQLLAHLAENVHGGCYTFLRQFKEGGPKIQVSYPPSDPAPVLLFGEKTLYSFSAEASPGAELREVRINGKPVFPNPDRPAAEPPKRIKLPFEDSEEIRADGSFVIEVADSRGGKTSCVISTLRRKAP